jgi:hypothetical protein
MNFRGLERALTRRNFNIFTEQTEHNALDPLIESVAFAYWEMFGDCTVLTIGVAKTPDNIKAIYQIPKRSSASLYPVTIRFDEGNTYPCGSLTFYDLKFKSLRSSVDYKDSELAIAKISFIAGRFEFDDIKLVP